MSDILDFYMELPAMMAHVDPRKPLCNKGAQKPPKPPPAMAPYEEVQGSADTSFSKIAMQRKGLRSTILSQPTLSQPAESTLSPEQMATLGQPPIGLGQRGASMAAQVAQPPQRPAMAKPTSSGAVIATALGQAAGKMK